MADVTVKLSSFWTSFYAHMKRLEGTTHEGSSQTIRNVKEGEAPFDSEPKPVVAIQFLGGQVVGRSGVNKNWAMTLRITVISNVTTSDGATPEIISKIAQLQNHLEAYSKLDGIAGLEDPKWSVVTDNKAGTVSADATVSFSANVARGNN